MVPLPASIYSKPNNSLWALPKRKQNRSQRVQKVRSSKEINESNVNPGKTARVIKDLLKDEKGVGIIAVTLIAGSADVASRAIDNFNEAEVQPALQRAPESIKEWKGSIADIWKKATKDAEDNFKNVAANVNEAWVELQQSSNDINSKMSQEAQLGARNWEKTTSSIVSPPAELETGKDIGTALSEGIINNASPLLNQLQEGLSTALKTDKKPTGWASPLLGMPVPEEEEMESLTSARDATAADAGDSDAVKHEEEGPAAGIKSAVAGAVNMFMSRQQNDESATRDKTPVVGVVDESTKKGGESSVATSVTPSSKDAAVRAASKGGRHVSMLTAPVAALGLGGGGGGGGDGNSGAAAAVVEGTAAVAAARDGGNGGGSSDGGSGGGGNNDDSNRNNNNEDGNENGLTGWWWVLLVGLAGSGYYYYYSEQKKEKEA